MKDTIEIDGETYRKIAATSNDVLVRTQNAGVHVGEKAADSGTDRIILGRAVRIWRWRGANTLHEVALNGVDSAADSEYTRVSEEVEMIELRGVIEVIPVTPAASDRIRSAGWAL